MTLVLVVTVVKVMMTDRLTIVTQDRDGVEEVDVVIVRDTTSVGSRTNVELVWEFDACGCETFRLRCLRVGVGKVELQCVIQKCNARNDDVGLDAVSEVILACTMRLALEVRLRVVAGMRLTIVVNHVDGRVVALSIVVIAVENDTHALEQLGVPKERTRSVRNLADKPNRKSIGTDGAATVGTETDSPLVGPIL